MAECPALNILFVHVERTAGSTIHGWFNPYTGQHRFDGRFFVVSSPDELPVVVPRLHQKRDSFYFGGHVSLSDLDTYGVTDESIPQILFSMTREPVERVASLYSLMKRSPEWLGDISAQVGSGSIEDFYDACVRNREFFQNANCTRISGAESFEATKRAIEERYTFVGSSDAVHLVANELKQLVQPHFLRFKPKRSRLNSAMHDQFGNSKTGSNALISASLRDRILRDNAEDAALHKWVTDHGGIVITARGRAMLRGWQGWAKNTWQSLLLRLPF